MLTSSLISASNAAEKSAAVRAGGECVREDHAGAVAVGDLDRAGQVVLAGAVVERVVRAERRHRLRVAGEELGPVRNGTAVPTTPMLPVETAAPPMSASARTCT